jgi:hypothetical protein
MGWLRKKAKQIGKAIKKVGKKIKNVLGKIAKPFAKLGIVGQIALGFLMPWAAGAVWQGLTGTTFSLANFGTVAGNLAQSTNLFKSVAGNIMKGIHWGATKIQGAYNSVTGAISDGFEAVTNKAKEMFGMEADASDLIKSTPDMKEFDLGKTSYDKAVADAAASKTVEGQLAQTIPDAISGVTDDVIGEISTKVTDKTIVESLKEKGKEAILDIPSKLVTGAVSGVGKGIAASIAQPDVEYTPEVADFLSMNAYQGYTTFNEVDFTKLNQYNDQIGSQAGIYGGPIHTVSFSNDPTIGLSSVDNYIQGLMQGR